MGEVQEGVVRAPARAAPAAVRAGRAVARWGRGRLTGRRAPAGAQRLLWRNRSAVRQRQAAPAAVGMGRVVVLNGAGAML